MLRAVVSTHPRENFLSLLEIVWKNIQGPWKQFLDNGFLQKALRYLRFTVFNFTEY